MPGWMSNWRLIRKRRPVFAALMTYPQFVHPHCPPITGHALRSILLLHQKGNGGWQKHFD